MKWVKVKRNKEADIVKYFKRHINLETYVQ